MTTNKQFYRDLSRHRPSRDYRWGQLQWASRSRYIRPSEWKVVPVWMWPTLFLIALLLGGI